MATYMPLTSWDWIVLINSMGFHFTAKESIQNWVRYSCFGIFRFFDCTSQTWQVQYTIEMSEGHLLHHENLLRNGRDIRFFWFQG